MFWSCLPSAGHGQDTAPVRDSHRWLWGLLSHPAAPHHHLRLRVEVSNPTSNVARSGFSLSLSSSCSSPLTQSSVFTKISRYIRSERSVILINFCLSIICSNALILVGQTQARNKVKHSPSQIPTSLSQTSPKTRCFGDCGSGGATDTDFSSFPFLSGLPQVVCTLVAALLHFFFLSSFCWVLTEAWQSYMAVTGRLRNRIIRKRFLCLGWGKRNCLYALLSFFSPVSLKLFLNFARILSFQAFPHWLWPWLWVSQRLRDMALSPSKFRLSPNAFLFCAFILEKLLILAETLTFFLLLFSSCWLSLEGGLLYSFVGPAAAVVLVRILTLTSQSIPVRSLFGKALTTFFPLSKQVNMVIGILVFNKLVSKDGITDVKLKERAG